MALDIDNKDTEILTEIYTELDIKTIQEIIKRISKMGDLSLLNEYQIRGIKEKDRKEIFQKTLEEVGFLTAYKHLYEYRGKKSKLNEVQIDMLNSGLRETQNLIRNFTGTIAYASENTYVEAVDKAYLEVLSGEKAYDKAIYDTYKNLAKKGIKLTDEMGRNIQIDTAVERNLRMGLQSTADRISDSIFNELGCDGYEVSAHSGARPTHAIAQGRQYALTREDAKKYGVGYWYDTVDGEPIAELWSDYNCRHSYFPIILGQSENNYNKSELRKMRTESVNYNGKKMSLYDAKQKQHYYESNIRKTRRAIESLNNSNDSNVLKVKESLEKSLKNYQAKYREFNNATGLSPDYTRTRI